MSYALGAKEVQETIELEKSTERLKRNLGFSSQNCKFGGHT